MKILRILKDACILAAIFPMLLIVCALNWDDELLGGRGD